MADELLTTVIRTLEREPATNAATQRDRLYRALVSHGVDVAGLVRTERLALIAEIEARAGKKPSGTVTKLIAKIKARLPAPRPAPRILQTVEIPKGGTIATSERVRTGWVIDQCQHVLTGEEYAAAERLRRAYGMTIGRSGASWEAAGGAQYVPVMPIQDQQIATWRAIWMRLDPCSRCIVWNFVVEQPLAGLDRPMSADEFGMLFGATKDRRRARGVVDGAIKVALSSVADLLRLYDQYKSEQGHQVARPLVAEPPKRIKGPTPWRTPSGPITDRIWLEDMRRRDGE